MGILKQDLLSIQAKRFKNEKIKGRPGNQFKSGMKPGMYEKSGECTAELERKIISIVNIGEVSLPRVGGGAATEP